MAAQCAGILKFSQNHLKISECTNHFGCHVMKKSWTNAFRFFCRFVSFASIDKNSIISICHHNNLYIIIGLEHIGWKCAYLCASFLFVFFFLTTYLFRTDLQMPQISHKSAKWNAICAKKFRRRKEIKEIVSYAKHVRNDIYCSRK